MADDYTPSEKAALAAYAEKVHASSRASEDEKAGRVFGYGRGLIDGRDLSVDERFCHLCTGGLDSSQHNTECVGSDAGLAAHDAAKVRQAKAEAVTDARKVISQYLATAEKWRYDRVMWAFAIMLGEIPEDSPEPRSPADDRILAGGEA